MSDKFLYFDLGKVLVDFDVQQMFCQIGTVAGIEPQRVREAIFGDGLQRRYESGLVTSRQFYEAFCEKTGTCADYDLLARAAAEIFTLNVPMLPLVAHLRHAGYRMGILSNTCENHWEYCRRRFPMLDEVFDVHALSYRIGACKPDAAIFHAAAELAGCAPQEIFFTDDLAEHVVGACAAGLDAVQFTTPAALAAELRKRGFRFNY